MFALVDCIIKIIDYISYMGNIPVVADLCHRDSGSGAPTAEERQERGVCMVARSPSIIEFVIESIQCSCDITLCDKINTV